MKKEDFIKILDENLKECPEKLQLCHNWTEFVARLEERLMSRKPTTNLTQLEAFAKEEWGIIELDTQKQDKMKKDIIQNECQIDEEDVNSSDRVDPSKFLKLKSSVNNNQRMLKFVILQSVLKMASSGYMRSTPDTGSPQVIQKLQERSFRL
ncbi:unnamed protein product [Lepeophtheirus salmonis]|uniref:(salmon louse) hypothetical protein n=1 Tax=Lepeophtheirus salmonis TaxID=72036 RepID=A0A7R8CDV1_LEPSM|nr:unnamed protein product [Lepeophtheirus salmonis]CAF2778970.1 unnamed protein product [Lepeophtheirus salmonis]